MKMPFTFPCQLWLFIAAILLAAFIVDDLQAMAIDDQMPSSMDKFIPQDSPKLSPLAQVVSTSSPMTHRISATSTIVSKKQMSNETVKRILLATVCVIFAVLSCLLCMMIVAQLNTTTYVVNQDESLLESIHQPHQPKMPLKDHIGQWPKNKPMLQARIKALMDQMNSTPNPVVSGAKAKGQPLNDAHCRIISGSNMSPTRYTVSPTESEQGPTGENETDLLSSASQSAALLTSPKPRRKPYPRLVATATVSIQVDQEIGNEQLQDDEEQPPPPKRIRLSKEFTLSK